MDSKFEEAKDEVTRALDGWSGGYGQFWSYSASHSTLEVRVERSGVRGNLHIVCIDCRRIQGPTRMPEAIFSLVRAEDSAEGRLVLQESNSGMKVFCNMVRVVRDVEPIYKRS